MKVQRTLALRGKQLGGTRFEGAPLRHLGAVAALIALGACSSTIEPGDGSSGTAGAGAANPTAGVPGAGAAGTPTTPGAGMAGMAGPGTGGSSPAAGGHPGSGGGTPVLAEKPAPVLLPTSRLARLSYIQWKNSVRDLLKLDVTDITSSVSGDAVVGFDNDIDSLYVDQTRRDDFEEAAQKLAAKVVADPAALARLVPAGAPTDLAGKAKALITSFGLRAYRRPLTEAEVQEYLGLFNKGPTLYPGVDAFTAGANLVLQLFLQSPLFLYRTELSTQVTNGKIPLNQFEVASKLAFALTGTMPDDTLLNAAAQGMLGTPAAVASTAEQLLGGARGSENRDHFHFQVYRLGAYDGIIRDATAFPDFKAATPAAMRQEVLLFLRWVFDQNLGIRDLYSSPTSFVNSTLAPLYGLSGNYTAEFQRVDLDPTQRAGLLTQPGFLSQYAVVNDPDSIRRGVFINTRVLCVTLPPPDPNAGSLVEPTPDMTNRERVEATTGPGTCGAGCHSTVINPPGFAFEKFDAVGKFRTTDRGKTIDASGQYAFADGLKGFDGAVEFASLVAGSAQAHTCYAQNWLSYVHGRPVAPEEQPLLDYFASHSLANQLSVKKLVLSMVTADEFLNRLP